MSTLASPGILTTEMPGKGIPGDEIRVPFLKLGKLPLQPRKQT